MVFSRKSELAALDVRTISGFDAVCHGGMGKVDQRTKL